MKKIPTVSVSQNNKKLIIYVTCPHRSTVAVFYVINELRWKRKSPCIETLKPQQQMPTEISSEKAYTSFI